MSAFEFFHPGEHALALPAGHRFPAVKYAMLLETLLGEEVLAPAQLAASPPADDALLHLAHDPAYVRRVDEGAISVSEMRRIGFPWSRSIPLRARATVGGAISAAKSALRTGFSGQLAGGTHHAHRPFGAGYCVFNDLAAAALALLQQRLVDRVAIIDLDVHQGDGNASILFDTPSVFVCSIHCEKNFPFRKEQSDLDIGLAEGTEDDFYRSVLDDALAAVIAFNPDIVLYQAGVDPLKEDRLGKLSLSLTGLADRDRMVFEQCSAHGVPVSAALGGGYADPIELSVKAHANTYRVAKDVYGF